MHHQRISEGSIGGFLESMPVLRNAIMANTVTTTKNYLQYFDKDGVKIHEDLVYKSKRKSDRRKSAGIFNHCRSLEISAGMILHRLDYLLMQFCLFLTSADSESQLIFLYARYQFCARWF